MCPSDQGSTWLQNWLSLEWGQTMRKECAKASSAWGYKGIFMCDLKSACLWMRQVWAIAGAEINSLFTPSPKGTHIQLISVFSPEYSLEGLMQKLKLQYFGYVMERIDLLENILMLGGLKVGGEGDDRGWDGWMASLTRWTWVWVNSGSWWWTGRPGVLQFMGSQRVGHDWATELNWNAI